MQKLPDVLRDIVEAVEALPAVDAHHHPHRLLRFGLTKVRQIGQPKIEPVLNWSKLSDFGVCCNICYLYNPVLVVSFHVMQKSLNLLILTKSYSCAKVAPFFFRHTAVSTLNAKNNEKPYILLILQNTRASKARAKKWGYWFIKFRYDIISGRYSEL